jgi:hypothetical protein
MRSSAARHDDVSMQPRYTYRSSYRAATDFYCEIVESSLRAPAPSRLVRLNSSDPLSAYKRIETPNASFWRPFSSCSYFDSANHQSIDRSLKARVASVTLMTHVRNRSRIEATCASCFPTGLRRKHPWVPGRAVQRWTMLGGRAHRLQRAQALRDATPARGPASCMNNRKHKSGSGRYEFAKFNVFSAHNPRAATQYRSECPALDEKEPIEVSTSEVVRS